MMRTSNDRNGGRYQSPVVPSHRCGCGWPISCWPNPGRNVCVVRPRPLRNSPNIAHILALYLRCAPVTKSCTVLKFWR
jgi:hypothetical protein